MKTLLISLCGALLIAGAAGSQVIYLIDLHRTAQECNRIETERVEQINELILEMLEDER